MALQFLPLLGAAAEGAAIGISLAEGAKYIHDTMSRPLRKPANNVPPTSEKLKALGSKKKTIPVSPSTENIISAKKSHGKLATGISAGLAVGTGIIASAVNDSLTKIETSSTATKTANDATKNQFADSHFLKNQVDVKQSIDYLIDAINAQSVVIFQGLSPLSAYMEALVVGVQALTDAVLGLDPAVTLPSLSPVINTPTAPAPVVNVSSSPATVNVSSTAPTVNVEAPTIPDYTAQMDRIADSADAVKEHHEYLKTPLASPDVTTETGTLELSPRDASHAKNTNHARGEADENNIGGDLFSELEDIFDSNEINMIKMFAYTRIDSGFGFLNSEDNSSYDSMINERYKL